MKETLIDLLLEYIRQNNPDLMMQLEEDGKVTQYLINKVNIVDGLLHQSDKDRPAYIMEDACMEVLTQDIRPSRFNYICNILEEEFETTYQQFQESDILQFEVINLVNECSSVFDDLNFSEENESNRFLRYCIIGTIGEYLGESVTAKMK